MEVFFLQEVEESFFKYRAIGDKYTKLQEPILKVSEAERPDSALYGGNLNLVSRHENVQVARLNYNPIQVTIKSIGEQNSL